MRFEFFIANRLKTSKGDFSETSSKSISFAIVGMTLAIVIIILSISIVVGFKNEISNKIHQLQSHIKVEKFDNIEEYDELLSDLESNLENNVEVGIFKESPTVLKNQNNFKGMYFRGCDNNYDWSYLNSILCAGKIPDYSNKENNNSILISKNIAKQLDLEVGKSILAYYIGDNVKLRKYNIVGIFNSDFSDFDNNYIIGSLSQLNNISNSNTTNYIGINCKDINDIESTTNEIKKFLFEKQLEKEYFVSNLYMTNLSYFTWLSLLDTNAIVIILIMIVVTCFTLISAMLMIVLKRVNMIGLLKTLGATDNSISRIFMFVTNKLILKSLLLGNVISILMLVLQDYFHIVKLDAESYYISYVPVDINITAIMAINLFVVAVAYISLLFPSKIVSSIMPIKSTRYE